MCQNNFHCHCHCHYILMVTDHVKTGQYKYVYPNFQMFRKQKKTILQCHITSTLCLN